MPNSKFKFFDPQKGLGNRNLGLSTSKFLWVPQICSIHKKFELPKSKFEMPHPQEGSKNSTLRVKRENEWNEGLKGLCVSLFNMIIWWSGNGPIDVPIQGGWDRGVLAAMDLLPVHNTNNNYYYYY